MIGRLPKLEVLKLLNVAFEGKEWDTSDDEFQELRCLKLDRLQIVKWNIDSSDHFPKPERLVLQKFEKLEEIPPTLGEMLTLQMIEIQFCSELVVKSAMQFHDNLVENGNEELKIIAIIGLQRGIPSKRDSSTRVDYVLALCTHRPSLLPIEWFGEVFKSRQRRWFATRDIMRNLPNLII
ncbi:hypothetical protein Pfo_031186 [Paulownia fortunei]|nr:hypothetical protein Pfo_031186 [Paulownia fortunei]